MMSYTQLSTCKKICEEDILQVKNYLKKLSTQEKNRITISKIAATCTSLKKEQIGQVVDYLVENHILIPHFGIRCSECGMIIEDVYDENKLYSLKKRYCYHCEEEVPVDKEDIICLFKLIDTRDFFESGQHMAEIRNDVAQYEFSECDVMGAVIGISSCMNEILRRIDEKEKEKTKFEGKVYRAYARNNKINLILNISLAILSALVLYLILNNCDNSKIGATVSSFTYMVTFFIGNVISHFLPTDFKTNELQIKYGNK